MKLPKIRNGTDRKPVGIDWVSAGNSIDGAASEKKPKWWRNSEVIKKRLANWTKGIKGSYSPSQSEVESHLVTVVKPKPPVKRKRLSIFKAKKARKSQPNQHDYDLEFNEDKPLEVPREAEAKKANDSFRIKIAEELKREVEVPTIQLAKQKRRPYKSKSVEIATRNLMASDSRRPTSFAGKFSDVALQLVRPPVKERKSPANWTRQPFTALPAFKALSIAHHWSRRRTLATRRNGPKWIRYRLACQKSNRLGENKEVRRLRQQLVLTDLSSFDPDPKLPAHQVLLLAMAQWEELRSAILQSSLKLPVRN